jgi:hypothetical protein
MFYERERLVAGKCNVEFVSILGTPSSPESVETFNLVYIFDFRDDLLFFLQTHELPANLNSAQEQAAAANVDPMSLSEAYVRSAESSIRWNRASFVETIDQRTVEPSRELNIFDPRLVGLVNFVEVDRRERFNSVMSHIKSAASKATVTADNQLARLVWRADGEKLVKRSTLVLDINRGASPVEFEVAYRTRASIDANDEKPWRVAYTNKTSWKQLMDVWVPETWIAQINPHADRGSCRQYTFEWESVNENIDRNVFTLDGLNLPKGTIVQNAVLGSTFTEKVVGNIPFAQPEVVGTTRTSWRIALVVINALLIVVIISAMVWKRLVTTD